MRRRDSCSAAAALVGLVTLGACAPALPSLAGGGSVPRGRTDLAFGGAARLPLAPPAETPAWSAAQAASRGGVAPVAYLRHGLGPDLDVGLLVAGTVAQPSLRYAPVLSEGDVRVRALVTAAPLVGWGRMELSDAGAGPDPATESELARVGFELPALIGVDVGGVVELWTGPRLRVEHAFGEHTRGGLAGRVSATGLSVGGVLGLGFGFRSVAGQVELTAAYESWSASGGATPYRGLVLTPAFALRFRL